MFLFQIFFDNTNIPRKWPNTSLALLDRRRVKRLAENTRSIYSILEYESVGKNYGHACVCFAVLPYRYLNKQIESTNFLERLHCACPPTSKCENCDWYVNDTIICGNSNNISKPRAALWGVGLFLCFFASSPVTITEEKQAKYNSYIPSISRLSAEYVRNAFFVIM